MKSLILFLFFFSATAYGSLAGKVLSVDLSINDKVILGQPFEMLIQIYPREELDNELFVSNLIQENFLDAFKTIEVISVKKSKNNHSVLEIKLKVVYVKLIDSNLLQVYNDSKNYIPFEFTDLHLGKDSVKVGKPILLVQNELSKSNYKQYVYFISLIFVLVFVLLGFLVVNIRNKKKILLIVRNKKLNWSSLFNDASSREDFEFIYGERNMWIPLLEDSNKLFELFFEVLNKHQYKENLDDSDLKQISESFDVLRGAFDA